MKQKRNRGPAPKRAFTGETLATWQSDMKLVQWAQEDEKFRLVLTVLVNERNRAFEWQPGETENLRLGRVQGYEQAVGIMQRLAEGQEKTPLAEEPTYSDEENRDKFIDQI